MLADKDFLSVLQNHLLRLVPREDLHALFLKSLRHHRGNLGILADQDARQHLHLAHPRAEAGEHLRELAADRPAAQHHQAPRQLAQVPHRVGGQHLDPVDPGNRRHQRPRARGDDDGTGRTYRDFSVGPYLDFPGRNDSRFALQALHPQARISLDGVVWLYGLHDALHALHNIREVEFDACFLKTIVLEAAELRQHPGGLDERLGRHAAGVQAIAAHAVLLDQRHLGFHCRGDVRRHQPRRAGADHHQIAVEPRRASPTRVDAPRLECLQRPSRHQGKYSEQGECRHQAHRQPEFAELGAGINVDEGAREHTELAHPVESPGAQRREPHHQVDDEERKRRHQAQRKQVVPSLLRDALVDRAQLVAEALLDPIAQQEPAGDKGERRADGRSERHDHGAPQQAENGAADESHDRRARKRQRRHRDVDGQVDRRALHGMRRVKRLDRRALLAEVLQPQVLPGVQVEERRGQRGDHNEDGDA